MGDFEEVWVVGTACRAAEVNVLDQAGNMWMEDEKIKEVAEAICATRRPDDGREQMWPSDAQPTPRD